MKHIKRKFTHQVRLPKEVIQKIRVDLLTVPEKSRQTQDQHTNFSGYDAWIITDKDYAAKTFRYNPAAGRPLLIPEPEPVLIYFNIAQINCRLIDTLGSRKELIGLLGEMKDATKIVHNLYAFLGQSSAFAVFSFMAVECLVNKMIPDKYSIKDEIKLKEFTIEQIQQFQFMKKIKDILPEVTGKKFWNDHPQDYQNIIDLKDFRNEVVHTKKQVQDETYYQMIFTKALDFDYNTSLHAVRNFINYYREGLVEECTCGKDF